MSSLSLAIIEAELTHLRAENTRLAGVVQRVLAGPESRRLFERAPCFLCGYSGAGYFQPSTHPCATWYHNALEGR